MHLYNITSNRKKINQSFERLDILYQKIPDTIGCLENINKENGCRAWCCETQNPSVLYVEFLNTWNWLLKNFESSQLRELIQDSLHNYVFPKHDNGCVFFDKEKRLCKQHESRPFNCRIYGITPDDEFRPRYEKLKILYPNIRNQCDLVKTKNGQQVTKKNVDNWWLELKSIEMSIGIKLDSIHDDYGGTYRNFHDHLLLHLIGEEGMEYLTQIRLSQNTKEKESAIKKVIDNLDHYLKNHV